MHGFKRPFLHEWLQIEIDYLQELWEWYDTFESFENVEFDANEKKSFSSLSLLV
jgi:hypothetical protein